MLMKREDSLLLVIDVQERLAPAMDSPREVITGCAKLLGVARRLNIPFILTEQYPKGLGQTMYDLRKEAGEDAVFLPKVTFSCASDTAVMQAIKSSGRKQIVLAGIETHICVLQTALDLQAMGYEVFVVANACSSRQPVQKAIALQRLMLHGIDIVTLEMVFFEWLGSSDIPEFKEISKQYIV